MGFYQSIAKYYDYIFPPKPVQVNFVKSFFKNGSSYRIIDIGAGTGNLSLELSKVFDNISGIELDKEMFEIALEKAKNNNKNISFENINMLNLTEKFEKESFDAAVCFGNTLVHLNNDSEISDFLSEVKNILKTKGKLLIQIINYDRIIDNNIKSLPTIENEYIKFERFYDYNPHSNKVSFKTVLTDKQTNNIIDNCIDLYAIRKLNLEQLLKQSGFQDIKYYGNFNKEELTKESIPLIISCKKMEAKI